MELLSDKKLLYYLRFYSVYLIFMSFCVIVAYLVQAPGRIVSIITYLMICICGISLLLLSKTKRRSSHEKQVFIVATISAICDIITAIAGSNVHRVEYAFSLLIAYSLCLYILWFNKLPGNKLVNACMIVTVIMAGLLVWSMISYYTMELAIGFENKFIFVASIIYNCIYIFNALFFPIVAYRLMLSKARLLDAQ